MKKFLSVLLALAVAFTFTFGSTMSAFAAVPTADEQSKIAAEAAKYTDQKFENAAQAYIGTLTIKDGKLVDTATNVTDVDTATQLIDEAIVKSYVNTAKEDAKTAFSTAVAALYTADRTWNDVTISSEVQSAFNTAINAKLSDGYVFATANVVKMLKEQLKLDQESAATAIAKYADTSVYSNLIDDWKITVSSTNDIGTPETYASATISGKAAGTVLTAKAYVDAILATQGAAAKTEAATETVADYVTAIGTVNAAAKTVSDVLGGHKITTDENYYIEAVPTKADLAADTTVATAKSKAIDAVKTALAAKKVELADGLQAQIDALNKYASLTTEQKATLASLNEQKANLDANIANYEQVAVANINYCTTTNEVARIKASELRNIASLTAALADYALVKAKVEKVAELEADAALLAKQIDVNGKPYYDADALAEDLADKIEAVYGALSTDAVEGIALSTNVVEETLIATKIAYIDFINGTRNNLVPKDSKGQNVNAAWNTPDAKATADTDAITAMKLGTAGDAGFSSNIAGTDALYDDAAIAELTALVKSTEEAITAATTVAEVKAIFAEANDKYNAIKTVNDHHTAWETTLGAAYTKAKYEKELNAYVTAASITSNGFEKYPTDLDSVAKVMTKVVYPVVYTAKSEAELAAKIEEAKKAVDAMKTTEQVAAQKKDVESAIAAISTTVTLADKDAIVAAKTAADEFAKVPGATTPLNQPVLNAAIKNYEALAAKELDDAYNALNAKSKLSTSDAEAVEALRTLYDAYADFTTSVSITPTATTDNDDVEGIEAKLLTAQVAAAKELMVNVPANPTTAADKAAVKAAREAYDALSLEGKSRLANTPAYRTLIDAEEYIANNDSYTDVNAKADLLDMSRKLTIWRTSKTSIKVTAVGSVKNIKANGYTVKYSFYKKAPGATSYKLIKTTTSNKYTYTNLKKGTNKFQVKVKVYDADGKLVATKMTYYRAAKVK